MIGTPDQAGDEARDDTHEGRQRLVEFGREARPDPQQSDRAVDDQDGSRTRNAQLGPFCPICHIVM